MQSRINMLSSSSEFLPFPAILLSWEREREDETEDSFFYSSPRLVYHQDHDSLGRLTDLYRELLPSGGSVVDLMSSWTSHLPQDVTYSSVFGVGMNEAELQSNPLLSSYAIQDLNTNPRLPQEAQDCDAVLICAGIQYLKYPEVVLAEVRKMLKSGGMVVVSFSQHCFETKATRAFSSRNPEQRAALVECLLEAAGFEAVTWHSNLVEPAWPGADRLFALSARKPEAASEPDVSEAARAGSVPDMDVIRKLDELVGAGPEQVPPLGVSSEESGPGLGGIMLEGIKVKAESEVVWRERWLQLVQEAEGLGIPRAQLVMAELEEGGASAEEFREAMTDIHRIIASRLSSDL